MTEEPEKVATAVPYNPGKQKFLVLKRNFETDIHPGKWNFPGGSIEEDDRDAENAAKRELKEETGLTGELVRSGEPFTIDTEDGLFRVHPFLMLVEDEPELNEEHLDMKWITVDELDELESVDGLKKDLRKVGIDL